jgi:hypothetical protein
MLLLKKKIKLMVLPTKNSWWILQLTGKKKMIQTGKALIIKNN